MGYWEGVMDWPLDTNWSCEICGSKPFLLISSGLTWGLVHAQCRCDECHTQYHMRNDEGKVVTTPICRLKTEYKEPFKRAWQKYHLNLSEISDTQLEEFMPKETEKC